jgi:DNA-binding IclR family transcriptional regulator
MSPGVGTVVTGFDCPGGGKYHHADSLSRMRSEEERPLGTPSREARRTKPREISVRSLARAAYLLERLAEDREATPRQLAESLGEPRTTVYRLLRSLEALDFVEPGSGSGSYRLGWKLLRLGAAVVERLDERQLALPVMERIHERIGETVFLLLRRDNNAVCVERLEGLRVQSLALRLGGSLPLHAGAGPRALLAWEPRAAWEEFVRSSDLVAYTERTPTTRTALFRELEETLERGYAISDEDVTPGIASVGAPIFDYTGAVRAAISVGGMRSFVLGRDRELTIELVVNGAREVSAALGQHAV